MSDIDKFKSLLEYQEADLQCLESCHGQGFTIEDWIELKKGELSYARLMMERLTNANS